MKLARAIHALPAFLICFSSPTFAEMPATEKEMAAVIALVKGQLKDPDSAQFRGIIRMENGNYCGWVNAKNSYGGYTGFSVFYAAVEKRVVSITPPDLSEPSLC